MLKMDHENYKKIIASLGKEDLEELAERGLRALCSNLIDSFYDVARRKEDWIHNFGPKDRETLLQQEIDKCEGFKKLALKYGVWDKSCEKAYNDAKDHGKFSWYE